MSASDCGKEPAKAGTTSALAKTESCLARLLTKRPEMIIFKIAIFRLNKGVLPSLSVALWCDARLYY
jgi:hypothetical protein